MAELTIKPEEIRAALDSFVKSYEPQGAVREEAGRVTLAGTVGEVRLRRANSTEATGPPSGR